MAAERVKMLKWRMQARKKGNGVIRCACSWLNCILKILGGAVKHVHHCVASCQETRIFRYVLAWSFIDKSRGGM
jgi:hypothetical protein